MKTCFPIGPPKMQEINAGASARVVLGPPPIDVMIERFEFVEPALWHVREIIMSGWCPGAGEYDAEVLLQLGTPLCPLGPLRLWRIGCPIQIVLYNAAAVPRTPHLRAIVSVPSRRKRMKYLQARDKARKEW